MKRMQNMCTIIDVRHFFNLQVTKDGEPISKCFVNDEPVIDTSNYLLFTDPPLEISRNKKIMNNYFVILFRKTL